MANDDLTYDEEAKLKALEHLKEHIQKQEIEAKFKALEKHVEDEFIEVPILYKHDQSKIIGTAKINAKYLPETPNYVFSIGYRVVASDGYKVTKHEVLEISLTMDQEYKDFLEIEKGTTKETKILRSTYPIVTKIT